MKSTQEKITALRALIREKQLDGYIIPKADEFQGEFVAPYAERLKWLSGFTGSAGTAVVLADKACVLTDGRYTLQLKAQIDTDVFEPADSVKTGVHGWLKEQAPQGAVIGCDPMLHTPDQLKKIQDETPQITLRPVSENLVDAVWKDQPARPQNPVTLFSEEIAGRSAAEKKKLVAAAIRAQGARAAVITLPDSVCWLLNLRGSDIDYIPVALSYAIVYADDKKPVGWIADHHTLGGGLPQGVEMVTLGTVHELGGGPVLLDCARSAQWFKTALEDAGAEVINAKDPCIEIKAVKTPSEFEAIKQAHILDGIALCKFFCWLEKQTGINEMDVGEKLQEFRSLHPAYKQPSFPTIAGYGANGAIVHYRAGEHTSKTIQEGSLLLVDSGGQYYDGKTIAGTTDITRTVAMGSPTEAMCRHFTLVLKGHIALARAHFPRDTTGAQIDALARQPLWDEGLDYAHGTGHGVGCYLAVHEEATSISVRGTEPFAAGMLISNEPGYYEEGAYGIRTENLVFVIEREDKFEFETLSLCPVDQSLVVKDMLGEGEIQWLNDYHARVYEVLHAGLQDEEERAWLRARTRPL